MHVDRERFLVFVGTLAAIGCGNGSAQQQTVAPVQVPEPVATMHPIAPPSATPSPDPVATKEPDPEPVPTPTGPPNPYDGTPVTAQTCDPALNAKGAAPKCAIKAPPGPTCESIGDTKKECPTMTSLLKPRVAQAAIECMNKRSGTDGICEFNVSSICAYEAFGSACLDPTAKTACNGVMKKCGPPDPHNKMARSTCEAAVSGIADGKRTKFISCISELCRFETCLTYL